MRGHFKSPGIFVTQDTTSQQTALLPLFLSSAWKEEAGRIATCQIASTVCANKFCVLASYLTICLFQWNIVHWMTHCWPLQVGPVHGLVAPAPQHQRWQESLGSLLNLTVGHIQDFILPVRTKTKLRAIYIQNAPYIYPQNLHNYLPFSPGSTPDTFVESQSICQWNQTWSLKYLPHCKSSTYFVKPKSSVLFYRVLFLELSNPLSSGAAGSVIYKVRVPATNGIKSGASVRWSIHGIPGAYFRVQSDSFSHAVFLLYKPDIVLPLVISNPDVNSATDNESPLPSQALLSGNRVIVADGVLRDGAVVKIPAI